LNVTLRLNHLIRPLSILTQRNFALVWLSLVFVGIGSQMETVVLGWFILTLTDSPFLVGLATSTRIAANFLAVFAGVLADRMPRQILLAIVEFTACIVSLLMVILILTGHLEVWQIFALTLAGGLARMFHMPAGQSLAADTLPQERVGNGLALTNAAMNVSTIIGPLIGGWLFQISGPQGAYLLIALLNFSGGVCALLVRANRVITKEKKESVIQTTLEGFRYVKREQVLWAALLVAAIINLTGFPFHTTLMPIFARDILNVGSAGLGALVSMFGVGALVGSIILAALPNLKHTGVLLILAVFVWHGSMILFSASSVYVVSLAILLITGMAFSSTLVLIMTVLFRTAPPEFRGRIMGLRVFAIYAHSFGSLHSGAWAGFMGAPLAAGINAVLGVGLTGLLTVVAPKLRKV